MKIVEELELERSLGPDANFDIIRDRMKRPRISSVSLQMVSPDIQVGDTLRATLSYDWEPAKQHPKIRRRASRCYPR